MPYGNTDDFRSNLGDVVGEGDIVEEARYTVIRHDGTKSSMPAFRKVSRVDPVTGAIVTQSEVLLLEDVGGEKLSMKAIAGFCQECGAIAGAGSFTHCEKCGRGLGVPCCAVKDDEDHGVYYCRRCYCRIRVRRFLRRVGKAVLSPFVEWEE